MAVWGYCMVCEKFVPIRQGEQKWGSTERRWYPLPHEDVTERPCKGDKVEIR